MVGTVIVAPDGGIIGEGWHHRFTARDAEVNTIASVADQSMLRDSSMYVTLEPCSPYRRQDSSVCLAHRQKGIREWSLGVSIRMKKWPDAVNQYAPRKASVEVETGCMEAECVV